MKTAQERAERVVNDLGAVLSPSYSISERGRRQRLVHAIAAAITEAQDARLEEAALFFESGGDEAWMVYPKEIARNVRSLKTGVDVLLERQPAIP